MTKETVWPFWRAMGVGLWLTAKRGIVFALTVGIVIGVLWLYFNNETANLIMTWALFACLAIAALVACAAGVHGAGENELRRREQDAKDLQSLERAEGKQPWDHVDDGGEYG